MTVVYALNKQPKLKSSNHIFTHSAARGVDLAADQYGQSIGAEVFASVSPSKHEYLQSIGVKYVSTSRDGEMFVSEMGNMVGNRGLHVTLLSGNLVRESLDLLVLGGHFLELGKRNILTAAEMREE